MPIQVNARLPDDEWERIVGFMPGMSNAERISQMVHQQLALLDARRSLPGALSLIERLLAPSLQSLREQGLRGKGAEVAEQLATTVAEMAAILLSHGEGLLSAEARTLSDLESQLMQRWSRATLHVLRTVVLDPSALRQPTISTQEAGRILDQAALLRQAGRPTAQSDALPAARSLPPAPSGLSGA